ncbi:alcohol dehydrogenase [Thelephora ganbajun]|uniref:Alcohol dehydrogenase n=1 Tax=Thelephora ganbajun TaxID=370292 RepID=A0ACB6ZMT6_THEGA|nr:alcohol dehydrogenase [Thelephora ganbajun]
MRAFVINQLNHPSKIELTKDAPEPKLIPDQILVDVYSAGLNFFDILQAQGKYQNQPEFPFILGSEFAGIVSQDSPTPLGCSFKPGDRVFGYAQGAYADRVLADPGQLLPLPQNLTFDQGAGIFVTWPTNYEGLVGRARLQKGEWVLVAAAAGGIGMSAVQIAKALGAKVIAAAGSQAKLGAVKKYTGADYLIDYTKPGWQKDVLKITGGRGVDVVYDPVGLIQDSLKCIAWKGRAVVVGFAGGNIEKLPLNLVLLKNIEIIGIHWGAYSIKEPGHVPSVHKAVISMLQSGKVTPVIFPEVYPLERLADGLVALENRKTWGKAIVRIRDEPVPTAKL